MPSDGSNVALVNIRSVSANVATPSDATERDYYEYKYAQGVYQKLISGWNDIAAETERQRDLRYIKDADSIELRSQGIIKPDEVYTPCRLIDTNIRSEQPSFVQYVTQSRRSIIFAAPDSIPVDGLDKLETDFTNKSRYLEWEIPFLRCIDGAQAHGWDGVEIIFDAEKPGNFCFEHIGHDRLIFSVDCESIEAQEVIAIKKNLTSKQLRVLVTEDGFSEDQVNKLIATNQKAMGSTDCVNELYEVFFKQNGIVNVGWYANACDDYLKTPVPLFMGCRDISKVKPAEIDPTTGEIITPQDYEPMFETEYPVVVFKYIESNDPRIVELNGRCKLDEASQEAASALQSSFVNGTVRASQIYGSPAGNNLDQNPSDLPILTDVVLGGGRLLSKPINFWHTPYPDAEVMQGMQAVIVNNKQEQSKVDFAALSRKDSGKTATEIQAATNKSSELSSVQVILLSIFIRSCYAKGWKITQNRVLQGKIIIKDPLILDLFGSDIEVDQQMRVTKCSGAKTYIIKSSGDVDVIQRNEKLQRLMQGWEVFGKTGIATEYLKDILRYAFPEDASRYISILEQGENNQLDMLKQLLVKTGNTLKAAVTNPATGQLLPSAEPLKNELMQLAIQIQQATVGGQDQQPAQLPQQQQAA
jgi:hypothetical protein